MTTRFEPDPQANGPVVRGFRAGGYLIADRIVPGGVLLTPETAADWALREVAMLTIADLDPVLAIDPPPEFVVLGTGATLRRPPAPLIAALEARGIGIEAMDSRTAARAWGMLRSEGRWISAALLPLDA